AVLVDEVGVGQVVLLGEGVLDVTDRVLGLLDVVGNAFVALGAATDRPLDGLLGTDILFPLGAHGRQVVGEVVGRAGAVGTMNDGDAFRRELHLAVELGDRRIIPLGDLAE